MVRNIITAVFLLIYLVLAWFAGAFAGVNGSRLWALRLALFAIGFVAVGLFLWFDEKLKRDRRMSGSNAHFFTELDALVALAANQLKQRNGMQLSDMPILYVIGESNSAKTSVVQNCGVDPELLAGEPERDGQIAGTNTINVWLAGNTLFIEAGGRLANEPALWTYLLEKTQSALLSSSLSRTERASRGIVVCFDSERLMESADSIVASAQKLCERLTEAAEIFGSWIPVYALFTKLDRIAHFAEFVGNLSKEEAAQAVGATLTIRSVGEELFAQDAEANVSSAFDQIMYSLADRRIDFLPRETSSEKIPSIYEFPREVRKLRSHIVQFLVELSRPARLNASCFLRGFYFTGVRAVMISEMVMAPKAAAAASVAAATRMFHAEDLTALAHASSSPVMQTRKVPAWSFLSEVFNEVILADSSAIAVSRPNRHVEIYRAAMFCFVAALVLILTGFFGFSFVRNRAVEQDILGTARALQSSAELSPGQTASSNQLNDLEHLRTILAQLEGYEQTGAPWKQRFGLYAGDGVYPDASRIYFSTFRKLLLHPIQLSILQHLGELPVTAKPSDPFGGFYKELKAYLITTSDRDKVTPDFLVPALIEIWTQGRSDVDEQTQGLARKQFEYYTSRLATGNPIPSEADSAVVQHARQYLLQFSGNERIYQSMLAAAGRGNPDVAFNRQYPGSAQVVIEPHSVPAAFTRAGFSVVQDALANPEKYYGAEEWVLGGASSVDIPKEKLQEDLRNRYASEYLNHWRSFIREATVVRYGSLADAANKLRVLSGNRSPLMQLFWVAAINTNVDLPGSAKAFDAVQRVAGGATEDHPIGTGAQPYMMALNSLQGAIASAAGTAHSADTSGPINSALVAAGSARSSVGQVAQEFLIDNENHLDSQVRKLMDDPIVSAEALVRRAIQENEKQQQASQQQSARQ